MAASLFDMLIAITSAWAKKEPALGAGLETFCGADTCYGFGNSGGAVVGAIGTV
jgi:hypothetical protein